MKIETKFSIGDRVNIVDLDRQPAVVSQIRVGTNGTTYQINWFHHGERKEGWLFDHELEAGDR